MRQISIFDSLPKYKIDKPIRLIELFAGYGSQALALKYLGVQFEHWKIAEVGREQGRERQIATTHRTAL